MIIQQSKIVLRDTAKLLKHQKEKEMLRGEKFNVFSILKMETKENETHSAFLAALLNPEGSHLKGTIFIELFLKSINDKTIDIASAKVKTEHVVGATDYINKTGGRIDIYIWDKNGYTVSIENKIHAGDQEAQIERYCKHNKDKNTVYYLTLNGTEPSEYSKGTLICGTHFHAISYATHIIDWLSLCMKEASDSPILRESIKQYIILLKKLTYTMNNEEEQELLEVILSNYESSRFLANNINKTIANFNHKIRVSIFDSLTKKIGEKYQINYGNSTENANSQLWIRIKGYETEKLFFGIQNFSVNVDSYFGKGIFIGIFIMNGNYADDYKNLGEKKSNFWSAIKPFTNYKNLEIDLQNATFLNKLFTSEDFYDGFVEHIVTETIEYIENHTDDVIPFLKPL
jgi:hypothetical protein